MLNSLLIPKYTDSATSGWHAAPRLHQADGDVLQLARAGFAAQLQHSLHSPGQPGGIQQVAETQAAA
jgi:hypothetical protein